MPVRVRRYLCRRYAATQRPCIRCYDTNPPLHVRGASNDNNDLAEDLPRAPDGVASSGKLDQVHLRAQSSASFVPLIVVAGLQDMM